MKNKSMLKREKKKQSAATLKTQNQMQINKLTID
jgi:hypothetical protein